MDTQQWTTRSLVGISFVHGATYEIRYHSLGRSSSVRLCDASGRPFVLWSMMATTVGGAGAHDGSATFRLPLHVGLRPGLDFTVETLGEIDRFDVRVARPKTAAGPPEAPTSQRALRHGTRQRETPTL